ncbi:MAG: RNA polymerase sigma-54 factor, partial [Bacteroidales bacterium]|nr:RNA polymerase sigma-54 factor [Bacteroidales bacterium]
MQKQGLELKQTQRLSPLQIQTIKLIELPVQELEQKIRSELEENPVLDDAPDSERRDDADDTKDISIDEIKDDGEIPSYKTRINNWGKDPRPEYNTFSVRESFTESLMEQLGYRNLDDRDYQIGRFIIGSLDSDGYLRRDIESLVDDMAFRAGMEVSEAEVEKMLATVQEFDPAGVGARDLRECLLLQLKVRKQTEEVRDAYRILNEQFLEFTNRHFNKVMSRLSLDEARLKAAISCISRLNPAPGGQLDDSYAEQAQQ